MTGEPAARVVVLGEDKDVRRHVVRALVEYALRRQRDRLPVPWQPGPGGVQVTDSVSFRPDPPFLASGSSTRETEPVLLDLDDVAAALRCGRRTVERLAQTGALPVVHVGRSVRVRRTDFEQYVDGLVSGGGAP